MSCPFRWATQALAAVTGTRWLVGNGLRSAFFSREKVDDVVIDEYARLLDRPGRLGVLGGVCKDFFSAEYDRMVRDYGEMKPETLIVWGEESRSRKYPLGAPKQDSKPRLGARPHLRLGSRTPALHLRESRGREGVSP